MTENDFPKQIRDEARAAWHSYIDFFMPFRPELFRYCRRLTGDVWDAEDLVQEAMLNGFGVLGRVNSVANPRGYLVRIATNLWLDAVRRRKADERVAERECNEQVANQPKADPAEVREAAATLMHVLGPQERAAFLLKDVFDMSLEQIAEVLATSVGAVKTALHLAAIGSMRHPGRHLADRRRRRGWSIALLSASTRPTCRGSWP